MAKIVDIAAEIYLNELDQDSETSIAAVAQALRSKIGSLNNLLNKNYYIDATTLEVINADDGAEIGVDESSIFKKIYLINYYERLVKKFLGASGTDTIRSLNQDGVIVTFTDKNQIAQTYRNTKKDIQEELKQLVNRYRHNRSVPSQVVGDDALPKNPPLIVNPLNNASTYEGQDFGRRY
jgi:hypothetical protein